MGWTRLMAQAVAPQRRKSGVLWSLALVVAVSLAPGSAGSAAAQQPAADTSAWNDARVLELMRMARERRQGPIADTSLSNYQARAEGLVYFYLDRRDVDERILVRTDQVALEVFWAQPDQAKQRIVGLRNENSLPNRMYYHLDHLTVVQNGFGDVMRMGDGDEVRNVPHPAAPGSDSIYDFRLADSLTLQLPGAPVPIKAYEIETRPQRTDRPAFVGTVYVDHLTGDIVRMTFTFTPVSYVDPRLDYINISLDNSLWDGRYWLPYEQAVEIRRQVPELDFLVSSVIQARFRVRDYSFNLDLPRDLFWGYRVTALPRDVREAYRFDRGIYDDLHDAGLAPPPELEDVRVRAASIIRDQVLSGLPRLRLSLPNASSAFRFNRAEGVYLGWGGSFAPGVGTHLEIVGGYAVGAAHAPVSFTVRHELGEAGRIGFNAHMNGLRDIGPRPGMPQAMNTIASFWGDDYLDPFFASGASLAWQRPFGSLWQVELGLSAERHETAMLEIEEPPFSDTPFRPIRGVTGGTQIAARLVASRRLSETDASGWAGSALLEAGTFDGEFFARPILEIDARRGSADRRSGMGLRLTMGVAAGSFEPQHLFLIGGRNTLPGYDYRAFSGDVFALARAEANRELLFPFIRGRITAAAGFTDSSSAVADLLPGPAQPGFWVATPTDFVRTSLGAGVGLIYDMLRIDLVRGLSRGGSWQLLISLDPKLWPML